MGLFGLNINSWNELDVLLKQKRNDGDALGINPVKMGPDVLHNIMTKELFIHTRDFLNYYFQNRINRNDIALEREEKTLEEIHNFLNAVVPVLPNETGFKKRPEEINVKTENPVSQILFQPSAILWVIVGVGVALLTWWLFFREDELVY